MATETELKFRIPPQRLAALRRAVATAGAQRQPLAAAYFDTTDQQLAQARMALRLRREGEAWVQTLKAEGASSLQRLEHNVTVATADGQRPALDIGRHDGSEAGAALHRLLGAAGAQALVERYATTVQRTHRVLRSGGARIELALDEGQIHADGRQLALCEIEFELLSGPPQALLALAGRWAARFGLLLDLRSKSELGQTLANGLACSPPARARPLALPRQASLVQARMAMLAPVLRQVLANASQIAAGPSTPEHLHQLRVGLRRLRSLLGVAWPEAEGPDSAGGPAFQALQAQLATLFGQLGAARDDDVMQAWLWPALQAAGSPLLAPAAPAAHPAPATDPAQLLRAPATQQLWLALLGLGLAPKPGALPEQAAAAALARPLRRLQRQVWRDARGFAELDDAARHRLRRRIKRLRYLVDLSAGLWPAKPMARLLRRLKQAQAPLGVFNDTLVALAHCRSLATTEPRAWFAVGWLSARRGALLPSCAAALARLARLPAPWP